MGLMNANPLQGIRDAVVARFPDAELTMDPSENGKGSSFLDVKLGDYFLVVEWNGEKGFGVTSNREAGFGEGPEEVFDDNSSTLDRVLQLLLSKTKTVPPAATLGQLRRERSLTQEQLAGSLKVRQASIAKMERRSDILISTLQTIISAMGGRLRIRAEFPDGLERELHFSQSGATKKRMA